VGFAAGTVTARSRHLSRFAGWCDRHELGPLETIGMRELERYRDELIERRRADGQPLAWGTNAHHVTALRMLFAWAVRSGRLASNPAAELELPRQPMHLPRAVLSRREVERVLDATRTDTPTGLRDRAILETLYSTGLRRMELITLDVSDLQQERQLLFVREGKGRKDRVVPIGRRALRWVERYLEEVRPRFTRLRDAGALFLTDRGARIRASRLTDRLHRYIRDSGVAKPGAVHIFRHTMATLMHDGGADIRDLQEILGHARLETTQRYTHVSIERLKRVHARTHPAERGLRD
jgi:integrase/recombinase XerD